MGGFSINRNQSISSLQGVQPQRVSISRAPSQVDITPEPEPISQEAQKMVKQSGKSSLPVTIATSKDIEEVKNAVTSANILADGDTPANKVADSIMKKSCTPENLRAAISLLGQDHPKVNELKAELEQAGDDRSKLKTVRTRIVAEVQAQKTDALKQENSALRTQIAEERSPTDKRGLLRRILFSGNYRADTATAQHKRLNEQGQTQIDEASQLKKLAGRMMASPPSMASLKQAIEALGDHPEAAGLKARLEAPEQNIASLKALRHDCVNALTARADALQTRGQAEQLAGARIKDHRGEGLEEMLGLVSLGASLTSSANTFLHVTGKVAGGFMGVAGSTVGIVFGGVHLLTETMALRRNVMRYNDAVARAEGAKLVLLPAAERPAKIAALEAQVAALSQPGWLRTKSGRAADVEKLQSKIQALKAMGTAEASPEVIAVAKQTLEATAVKLKAVRIAKNIVGLAAGAIAISVAAGALATPIGWTAAGVAAAATLGVAVYNRLKASNHEKRINEALDNRLSAGMTINKLKLDPDTQVVGSPQHQALQSLEAQQQRTMIQLLTISPKHAAAEIIAGLKATPVDEMMRSLATQALNVPLVMTQAPFTPKQEAELKEYLMRGLPIQPKL